MMGTRLSARDGDRRYIIERVGGGSINECYKVRDGNRILFCKQNSAQKFPELFEKEKKGLELIRKLELVQTPEIIDCYQENDRQFLLLEWITEGRRSPEFWKNFGAQLAEMHLLKTERFGWHEWNYMGSIVQVNEPAIGWTDFFIQQRIEPLLKQCSQHQLISIKDRLKIEKLYNKFPEVFDPNEKPCTVHGDLWSGNFLCNEKEQPVLIDPAAYYGHRSVDLAMTTLFGGFDTAFYEAYHYHYPFPLNYKDQWQVCNLYPLLIHLLLFGKSYLISIQKTLEQFA